MEINVERNYGRTYTKGDVYYIYRDPAYDYAKGYAIDNKEGRPAVIVSNDVLNRLSHKVMVVYLTRNSNVQPEFSDFLLESTKCIGSKVISGEICAIHKNLIGDYIGHINDRDLSMLDESLLEVLALPEKSDYSKVEFSCNAEDNITNSDILFATVQKERDFYKEAYENLVKALTVKNN